MQEGEGGDFVVVVADLEDAVVVASLVGVAYQEVVEAFLAGVAYQEAVGASQEDVASPVEVGAFQDGQMESL